MKVIIAEKPSVAREIARVVRATNKKNGYIEGGGYAVTWALGHLITAAMPEAYGIKGFHKENLPHSSSRLYSYSPSDKGGQRL